jgi:hypothetical protein
MGDEISMRWFLVWRNILQSLHDVFENELQLHKCRDRRNLTSSIVLNSILECTACDAANEEFHLSTPQ